MASFEVESIADSALRFQIKLGDRVSMSWRTSTVFAKLLTQWVFQKARRLETVQKADMAAAVREIFGLDERFTEADVLVFYREFIKHVCANSKSVGDDVRDLGPVFLWEMVASAA